MGCLLVLEGHDERLLRQLDDSSAKSCSSVQYITDQSALNFQLQQAFWTPTAEALHLQRTVGIILVFLSLWTTCLCIRHAE
jgi:hypothetical protein